MTEVADFLIEIARKETGGPFGMMDSPSEANGPENPYTTIQAKTHAFGKYQILPAIWPSWAVKALNLGPDFEARGDFDLPPGDWRPVPTPWRQELVALWRARALFRRLGDPRRCAGAWLAGERAMRENPQPAQWSDSVIRYVNRVCWQFEGRGKTLTSPLGFPETTRETVLPDLAEPVDVAELQAQIAELTAALDMEKAEVIRLNAAREASRATYVAFEAAAKAEDNAAFERTVAMADHKATL